MADHRHGDGETGDGAGNQTARDTDQHQKQSLDSDNFAEGRNDIVEDHR
jgi:hypothetical protein